MSKVDQGYSKKPGEFARTETAGQLTTPGPYIGIVKNNIDPTRSGRLQVYIPDLGGANENDESSWYTVSYASPFRGQSAAHGEYVQETEDKDSSQPENSIQSYGFWMVPPDLNIKVLCIFANSDPAQGYWFACIGDSFDMHMTPGIAAVPPSEPLSPADGSLPAKGGYIWDPGKYANHKMLQDYIELINPSGGGKEIPARLPVSEPAFQKQGADAGKGAPVNNIDKLAKVPHVEQTLRLGVQGLAFDYARGSTSASSVRENPSQVFGFSSPGRLHALKNKETAKKLIDVLKKVQSNSASEDEKATAKKLLNSNYRTGGHQIVLDDGTVDGLDCGIRIRTTQGNMILMDDSATSEDGQYTGQIYVINASGTAWMELSPSGRIDMFATGDFSVHTNSNINFHADNDINFHADNKINVYAESGIEIQSNADINQQSAGKTTLYADSTFNIGSTGSMALSTKSAGSFHCSSDLTLKGSNTFINTKAGTIVSKPAPIPQNNLVKTSQIAPRKVWWQMGTLRSICGTAPMHEPWPAHEIDTIETVSVTKGKAGPAPITRPPGGDEPGALDESDVANAPSVGAPATALSKAETRALLASIGKQESGNKYDCESQMGLIGKYQMGVEALIATGYINKTAWDGNPTKGYHKEILGNQVNWTGKNSVDSKQHFLENSGAQEDAMMANLKIIEQQLEKLNVFTDDTSHEDIGGYLAVAHLFGVAGAAQYSLFRQGKGGSNPADPTGMTAEKYFNSGRRAIQLGAAIGKN